MREKCPAKISHCMKSVHIRSYYGPCFNTFRLNTERCCGKMRKNGDQNSSEYEQFLNTERTQSECGKIRARKTSNIGTFYAVSVFSPNAEK